MSSKDVSVAGQNNHSSSQLGMGKKGSLKNIGSQNQAVETRESGMTRSNSMVDRAAFSNLQDKPAHALDFTDALNPPRKIPSTSDNPYHYQIKQGPLPIPKGRNSSSQAQGQSARGSDLGQFPPDKRVTTTESKKQQHIKLSMQKYVDVFGKKPYVQGQDWEDASGAGGIA